MSAKGFSLIETIIALALFIIIAAGGVLAFVSSLNLNRQSTDNLAAANLAAEGLEAVRSLGSSSFAGLVPGVYGLGIAQSSWVLVNTADTTGKFNRQIILSSVSRDLGGSVVVSGGTVDPDTILAQSTVTWNFSPGQPKQLSTRSYLTNWRRPIGPVADGLLLYSDGSADPGYRLYHNSAGTFSAAADTLSPQNGLNFIVRTSPLRSEALAGFVNSSGTLTILCFNGRIWNPEWSVNVGGNSTVRRFDIAYESTSGKAVVVYSTNSPGLNEINFRTKSGVLGCGTANWSSASAFDPLRTSGIIQWLKLKSSPLSGTNVIGLLWADNNADLSAALWNGTTFQNEPANATETSLEYVSAAQDVDDFDLEFESLSGNLMVIWANSAGGNGQNGVRYRRCTGATAACSWGTVAIPPSFADDATNLDLAANPASNEMVFASIGNAGSDLQIGYWSGSAWSATANADTSCATPVSGSRLVAAGWLRSGTVNRSVVVYHRKNDRNIAWYAGNNSTFSRQTDFIISPQFTNLQVWYDFLPNPRNSAEAMFLIADSKSNLYAKKFSLSPDAVFSLAPADGSASLTPNLSQTITNPFAYAWFQK